jgi:pilus assembly protein Flp/PilA
MPDFCLTLRRFVRDEAGATAMEYAMIASMLSVAVVGSAFLVGGGLQNVWNYVQTGVMAAFGD